MVVFNVTIPMIIMILIAVGVFLLIVHNLLTERKSFREKVSLEREMARMHPEISATTDKIIFFEKEVMDWVRKYIAFFPSHFSEKFPLATPLLPNLHYSGLNEVIPNDPNLPFDMHEVIHSFIYKGSIRSRPFN
ncbi:MAG: carboxyl transferase domain-containing protein [Methanomicrobiales archaeon]